MVQCKALALEMSVQLLQIISVIIIDFDGLQCNIFCVQQLSQQGLGKPRRRLRGK